MTNEIHVGNIGTVFERIIVEDGELVDISGADPMKFRFSQPDGTVIEKDAILVTDGIDGKLKYTTIKDDLSVAGTWKLQVVLTIGDCLFYSSIDVFQVYANLELPPE